MTQEQEKYLKIWINDLNNKIATIEKEIADIEKRKNILKASKDVMIAARRDIIEDTKIQLDILKEFNSNIVCFLCKNFNCKDNNIGDHSLFNCQFFKGETK